jgi:hypothetical protein
MSLASSTRMAARRLKFANARCISSSAQADLKTTLKEVIPVKREQLKKLKTEHGQKSLGEVKVENVIGGMRYVNSENPERPAETATDELASIQRNQGNALGGIRSRRR